MKLTEYQKKRDRQSSREPEAAIDHSGKLRFVVQRHRARRLHYDLRLEIGGVLKSWAIAKGPSLNPGDRRPAIETEDHPVKYLSFQGTIPKGSYGAGEMQIWDFGTFTAGGSKDQQEAARQWNEGTLHLELNGERLRGAFSPVRLKQDTAPGQWLFIKDRTAPWVLPRLVCEVKFAECTPGGRMHHPVYKGLCADKNTEEIRLVARGKSRKTTSKRNEATTHKEGAESLEVDGIRVPITNLDKIFWLDSGLSKYHVIDYCLGMAETLLPYLRDRPQSLHRHPNGIGEPVFFLKDHQSHPDWVRTTTIPGDGDKKQIHYLLCQKEATLLYMANLGCIEIHPFSSRTGSLDTPDYAVIDLDPSPHNSFDEVFEVALEARSILDQAGISGVCKTSGASGLHIYFPLGAWYTYREGRDFVKILCALIHEQLPQLTSTARAVKDRQGKIYLDYLQNRRGQTMAAPYCIRPRERAPVTAPLTWDEVQSGLRTTDFNISTMKAWVKKMGDIFRPVLGDGIEMEEALAALEKI